jgi:hypothetical protein
MRPVSRGRHKQHRFGCKQGGNFNIAGVESQPGGVLAKVAALHDRRHHVDRGDKLETIIHGRQQKGLCAASGRARHA